MTFPIFYDIVHSELNHNGSLKFQQRERNYAYRQSENAAHLPADYRSNAHHLDGFEGASPLLSNRFRYPNQYWVDLGDSLQFSQRPAEFPYTGDLDGSEALSGRTTAKPVEEF